MYLYLYLYLHSNFSGVSLAEEDYYGHGRADWREQVGEGVDLMEVTLSDNILIV